MAKDRYVACYYYIAEGKCKKGREGTFYKKCQTCDKYLPVKGGRPAKKNLKKEKLNKLLSRQAWW